MVGRKQLESQTGKDSAKEDGKSAAFERAEGHACRTLQNRDLLEGIYVSKCCHH